MSQEGLARAAGVSRATVMSGESGGRINASTLMLLLQALAEKIPIPRPDLLAFARLSPVSEKMVLSIYRATHPEIERGIQRDDELHALLDDLLSHADREYVRGILAAIRQSARRQPADPQGPSQAPHGLVVKHPPVQREGYVEQTEVEYTRPQIPPPKPKAQRRDAGA